MYNCIRLIDLIRTAHSIQRLKLGKIINRGASKFNRARLKNLEAAYNNNVPLYIQSRRLPCVQAKVIYDFIAISNHFVSL